MTTSAQSKVTLMGLAADLFAAAEKLDENNQYSHCEPTAVMKAIITAVIQAPLEDNGEVTSLLCNLLASRIERSV